MKHFKAAKKKTWLYGFTHRKRCNIIDEYIEYCLETDFDRTMYNIEQGFYPRIGIDC